MPADKKKAVELAYESEPFVLVVCRTDVPGTVLPKRFRELPAISIEIGRGLARPIIDLCFDENALSGLFSFDGVNHSVRILWEAIFVVNGRRETSNHDKTSIIFTWPESAPRTCEAPLEPTKSQRRRLRSV